MTIFCRSVLTRAELEALPLDNNLKEDVEKGKVAADDSDKGYVDQSFVADLLLVHEDQVRDVPVGVHLSDVQPASVQSLLCKGEIKMMMLMLMDKK